MRTWIILLGALGSATGMVATTVTAATTIRDTEIPTTVESLKGGKIQDEPMVPDNQPAAADAAKPESGAPPAASLTPKDTDKQEDTPKQEAVSSDTDRAPNQPPVEEPPLASAVPKDRMPTLSLKVAPKEAMVGQDVTWELSVKRKKEDSIHLEGGASFGGLEIQTKDKSESPASDGWVVETLKISLIGFDPGDIVIPKQKLTIVDVEGRISEVMTDKAFVTVKSLLGNEPEPKLKEDKGQGETVMEKNYLLLWICIVVAGIAATAGLTLLGRKLWSMRKPKPLPPPPPPRPAEEIAFEKLGALKRSNLLTEGQIKEFHVRLSEAVREYIGNRYRFDSLEMSSEELIQAIRRINMSRAEYELILDFLGETDLVKFAKALPSVHESEDLLTQSFGFVERTTPKEATGTVVSTGTIASTGTVASTGTIASTVPVANENANKPASDDKEADRA